MVSSILLVTSRRSGTFSTGVVAAGATHPAAVVQGAEGGLNICSYELLPDVRNSNMKFHKVLQGDEDLGVGGSELCGDCTFGRSESFYQGAITGCGRR